MTTCPTPDELATLLAENAPAHPALETHVEICLPCQQTLEQLAGPVDLARCRSVANGTPQVSPADPLEPTAAFLERLRKEVSPEAVVLPDSMHWPTIPGYEILSELGRGGSAVVYKASQIALNRIVALKVLPSCLSREGRRRARRGAEVIARFQHPNIVRVYEAGLHEGMLYGALDYLDGGTLADRLRDGPWPPQRAAELVQTLAAAAQVVHEAGFVHRDIKPANVLFNAAGVPKLADFGLARAFGGDDALTAPGTIIGTLRYLSPEQATSRDVGPPADIHALGLLLYEALTGRPPFDGKDQLDTLQQVVRARPTPPSQLRADIPQDLDTICLKCLQKDPAARYASAGDLAADLGRFLANEPIHSRPDGFGLSLRRGFQRTYRAILVLGAVAFFGGLLLAGYEARQQRNRTEQALDEAEGELYEARLALARSACAEGDLKRAKMLLDECAPKPGRPDRRGVEWQQLWQQCHPHDKR